MKVLLLKDIKGLGKAGELVNASEGYVRNMLLPSKSAQIATDSVLKEYNKKIEQNKAKEAKNKAEAEELAKLIGKEKIVISAKVGSNSKLFGAITNFDVSDAINKKYNLSIDKKKVVIKESIKALGTYHVGVKLYTGVVGEVTVEVIAE